MTAEEAKDDEKRHVLVGIRFDEHTKELLNWALVKVADPGDRVVAVHVTRNSDSILKDKSLLDGYLYDYQDLCSKLQVDLTGEVVKGALIRKVLVREAKKWSAMAVIVGISKRNPLGGWTSIAKYCANNLPITTEVLAIYNGKAVFRKRSSKKLPGFRGDPRPSFYINPPLKDSTSEFDEFEKLEMRRHSHDVLLKLVEESKDGDKGDSKDEHVGPHERFTRGLTSVSSCSDLLQQRAGWPLLRGSNSSNPTDFHGRTLSVVNWVMNLPSRSLPESPRSNNSSNSEFSPNKLRNGSGRERNIFRSKSEKSSIDKLQRNLELLFRTNSSGLDLFSHDVLTTSTSQFSTENLLAKGASNRVYKGLLPDGKRVAVKISKSSEETWNNFTMEVNILTSLKHKNITPLLGICVEHNDLISVHDFMSRGNLEQNLQSNSKDKSVMPWELRFNVAVGVAEALNYLHNECSQPVIHRDIKSSNILLSEEYQPQLADFGLALWGPTTTSFLTQSDVVGTFGYLAPEYFMYGKVSDKMDVYSFGVVLLELLSGKKSIGFNSPKGQESLVLWAKPKLESGDLKSIVDPNLDGNFDKAQAERMAIAATLCLTRAARLRPKMNPILKILKGEKKVEEEMNTKLDEENDLEIEDNNNEEEDEDDEVYPDSCAKSHLELALLDIDDDSFTSLSSLEQSSNVSVEEFLKGRWSRSSSLD